MIHESPGSCIPVREQALPSLTEAYRLRRRWGPAVAAIVVSFFLSAVFFAPVLFDKDGTFPWDFEDFHLPLLTAVADAWQDGEFPFWDPSVAAGRPLLANPQMQVLYPPLTLATALGRDGLLERMKWIAMLHVALTGAFVFGLARRLELTAPGAAFAAIMFAFGGYTASQAEHFGLICGLPWLVLAVWAALMPSRRGVAVLAVALSLSCLAGFLAPTLVAAVTALLFFVLTGPDNVRQRAVRFAAGSLLGVALSAPSLLAAAELTHQSIGQYRFEWTSGGGLLPSALLSLVIPNFHGVFQPAACRAPVDVTWLYLFSGWTGLVLAIWGLVRLQMPRLIVVAVVTLVLALGSATPVGKGLFLLLPRDLRGAIYWFHFVGPLLLVLSLMAGGALSRLFRTQWAWLLPCVLFIELLCTGANRPMNTARLTDGALLRRAQNSAREFAELRKRVGSGRIDSASRSPAFMNYGPVLHLRSSAGYDPLTLERVIRIRRMINGGPRWGAFFPVTRLDTPALPLLGVNTVISPDPLPIPSDGRWREDQPFLGSHIYVTDRTLPRLRIAHCVLNAENFESAAQQLSRPGFDLNRCEVAEGLSFGLFEAGPDRDTIQVRTETRQHWILDVQTDREGLLVIRDAWYPGWRATVDGRPQPVIATSVAFRGVHLKPGTHRVELTYQPKWFMPACLLSAFGLVAVLLLLRAEPRAVEV